MAKKNKTPENSGRSGEFMASRKEYEMMFRLSAEANGAYGRTFSEAQNKISSLGKQIAELSRLQGDVSSYQKQQKSIETTQQKLANLQKQHDLLQKEIKETGGANTSLEREDLKLQQRINDLTASLERQNDKLSQTGTRLEAAGYDTKNLAGKSEELKEKIYDLREEQEKTAESAQEFGSIGSLAIDKIKTALTAAGIAAAIREIGQEYAECVKLAADFEETMSTVEALSGASAEELNALSEMAKELGATTKFTAKEAAEAMTYMGMAGWGVTDMLGGMDGVLQLAAASGEDLAMVSDIVTDNLTAFGLKASDTAHFSDVLAAAATNSNTNVSIMGETFKQSAALAGALGYSVEDVGVAVGLMANAGIKGSVAGTALKNIFQGLLGGITLTGDALGEVEYSAINADGTMKSLGETLDDLRGYFSQMTGAEKLQNAETIAGQRAMTGFVGVLNATDEDFQALTESINNCEGAAEKMANIKLDNLNGEVTLMKSAWDALKTSIGEGYNSEIRYAVEWTTKLINEVNEWVKSNDNGVASVYDLTRNLRALNDSMLDEKKALQDELVETEAASRMVERYTERLEELEDQYGSSVDEIDEYHAILRNLVETVPELSNLIDLETGVIDGGTDAIRRNTEAWAENQRVKAYQSYADAMSAGMYEAEVELEANRVKKQNAETKLDALTAERERIMGEAQALYDEAQAYTTQHGGFISEYLKNTEYKDLLSQSDAMAKEINATNKEIRNYTEAVDEAEEAYEAAKEEADVAAESLQNFADKINHVGRAADGTRLVPGTAAYDAAYGSDLLNEVPGYASGTRNAQRGLAIVGENGPELVAMHGGETVLPADLTTDAFGRANVSVPVTINIEGNASEDTVQALSEVAETFQEKVEAALEQIERDRKRRNVC